MKPMTSSAALGGVIPLVLLVGGMAGAELPVLQRPRTFSDDSVLQSNASTHGFVARVQVVSGS